MARLKVIDVSRVLAGPLCCQLLSDLGADVIKVEHPEGDETRGWGPPYVNGVSSYYRSCNRGKASIRLDLGSDVGHQALLELIRDADVLVENFRSDSANKLRLTPSELWRVNPRLVIGTVSAYGEAAPDAPGYDLVIQAQSGFMAITGEEEGPPTKVGVAVVDVVTALYLANGIQAALLRRVDTGLGDHVEATLLGCAVAAQVNVAQAYLDTALLPRRRGSAHGQIVPYQMFATADDWLVLAIGNDKQWTKFCIAAERSEWAKQYPTNELRVRRRDVLVPALTKLLKAKSTAAWVSLCAANHIPASGVWDYQQLFEAYGKFLVQSLVDSEGRVTQYLRPPLRFRNWQAAPARPPPQ